MAKEVLRSESKTLQLTEFQLNILRQLGQGRSIKDIAKEGNQGSEVNRELTAIYRAFEVSGPTAAVVSALDEGLLKTDEFIDRTFSWNLFKKLNPKDWEILETVRNAKTEELTEEEFGNLEINSTDPKRYIAQFFKRICGNLGAENKTSAVVHYYAFEEKEQREEVSAQIRKLEEPLLSDKEKRVLELLNQGLTYSLVSKRLSCNATSVMQIIRKRIGAPDTNAVFEWAREMGILS